MTSFLRNGPWSRARAMALLALLGGLMSAPLAAAQLFEAANSGTSYALSDNSTDRYATRFQLSQAGMVNQIEVYGRRDENTSDREFAVQLRADNSGNPGTLLASGTGNMNGTAAWRSASVSSTLLLANTTYWLVFYANTSDDLRWYRSTDTGNSNRTRRSTNGGSSWSNYSSFYHSMRIHGTAVAAPTAADDAYGTDEDIALAISAPGVLANDSTPSGAMTAQLISGVAHGNLQLNADGSFLYEPLADWNGIDSFTYQAVGIGGNSATRTVTLTVAAVNDAPVAMPETFETDEDVILNRLAAQGVLVNDTDIDGDLLKAVLVRGPEYGSVMVGEDGSFEFHPAPDWHGTATFVYRAFDGELSSEECTVTIIVNPVRDEPRANSDTYTLLEDQTLDVPAELGVMANDEDVDQIGLMVELVQEPMHGELMLHADGAFIYVPRADFFGRDTFIYRLLDGELSSGECTVELNVQPVNDAPVARDDRYELYEDQVLEVSPADGLLANDYDIDSDQIQVYVVTENGTNPGNIEVKPDGSFTFYGGENWFGDIQFVYMVVDLEGEAAFATVTITVHPVNDEPTFVGGNSIVVNEDCGPQVVAGWAKAISAGPENEAGQSVEFIVNVTSGAALFAVMPQIAEDGTLIFTPAANAWGTAIIHVRLKDNGGTLKGGIDTSVPYTFEIVINPVNDIPTFVGGYNVAVLEDCGPQFIEAWATAISSGAGNAPQALAFAVTANSNPGLFAVAPALDALGNLSFVPAKDAFGKAEVTFVLYEVEDPDMASPPQTVHINVLPVNDAPSFVSVGGVMRQSSEGAVEIAGWATAISAGPENESGQQVHFVVQSVSNPELFTALPTVQPDGTLRFTAAWRANGIAVVEVVLMDNGGTVHGGEHASETAMFEIMLVHTEPESSENDACMANAGGSMPWLLPLALAGLAAISRRRRRTA